MRDNLPPRIRTTNRNPYLPRQAVIREIIHENELVNTYILSFEDELYDHGFTYKPGQFMMVSVPHGGEAPISFSSSPDKRDGFALTIRRSGSLTNAVHALGTGDIIGLRGPYGNGFPMERLRGKNLLFVAGGIGMAPLRGVIEYCLQHREAYGSLTILYGSKSPAEFSFTRDFDRWEQAGCCLRLTVDAGDGKWRGRVGLVTALLPENEATAGDAALVCGPGIMIRFVIEGLESRGYTPENIITTLERHMKCGIGVCGHCHFQGKLICTDGPVFSRDQLSDLTNL